MSTASVDSLASFVDLASHWGSAQLYWPSIIAGGGTVLLCVVATIIAFDASRRVAKVPQWAALQRAVHDLNAERGSILRVLEHARTELGELNETIEELRGEKNELERVRQLRVLHEAELQELLDALASQSEDRAQILALRQELRELIIEKQGLQDGIARLRDQHAEHAAEVEKAEQTELSSREQIARSLAERDAILQRTSHCQAEMEAALRNHDEVKAALVRREEEAADELQRLKEIKVSRAQVIDHISELRRRVSQLADERREIEGRIVTARAVQTNLTEENARLEADRSSLWMEVASLHARRKAPVDHIPVRPSGQHPAESGIFGKIGRKLSGAPEQRG